MTNEILKSRISPNKKAEALVKLGVTPYEAMVLAHSSIPHVSRPRPFSFTFGVEIECVNCPSYAFISAAQDNGLSCDNHLNQYYGCHTDIPRYKLVPDSSISGYDAAECVTPALKGAPSGFKSLESCCKALNSIGAHVNRSCGLHVHIGAANLTEQEYCNVFVNYMMLETAIDSFLAPSRRVNNRWARSLRTFESSVLNATSIAQMQDALDHDRYHKVNPMAYNRHRTIEFRQHQGSTNYEKISKWVKFLGKLVEFSKDTRLTQRIDSIEGIPFLTNAEKRFFIRRREEFAHETM